MQLAVITDEIDESFEHACAVAKELGLAALELNRIDGTPSPECDAAALDKAEGIVRDGRFNVCCLSTMAFKALLLDDVDDPADHPDFKTHLGWVRRGCELARRFGAPRVRIFAFRKSGMIGHGNPSPRLAQGGPIPAAMIDKVVRGLTLAARVADEQGVDLVIENVRSCWANSCVNTARILQAADHPRLKTVWDPGNDFVAGGEPFPEGYEAVHPWIDHVHVKNAALDDAATGKTRWERIGAGALDYAPMLRRLKDDGYTGAVTLETHWRGEGLNKEASSRASFADLKKVWDEIVGP